MLAGFSECARKQGLVRIQPLVENGGKIFLSSEKVNSFEKYTILEK